MRKLAMLTILAFGLAPLVGCDKKEDKKEDGKDAKKDGEKKAEGGW